MKINHHDKLHKNDKPQYKKKFRYRFLWSNHGAIRQRDIYVQKVLYKYGNQHR